MQRSQTCPKCQGNHILLIARVALLADAYGREEPLHIARVPAGVEGFPLPGGEPVPAGLVQAYVCRACGYTELYTRDPQSIPIDGSTVRELIGSERTGPYR
jgi:hypothetical protein